MNKQDYYVKGWNSFQLGRYIGGFNSKSWQSKAFEKGYRASKEHSFIFHDDPSEYQRDILMGNRKPFLL